MSRLFRSVLRCCLIALVAAFYAVPSSAAIPVEACISRLDPAANDADRLLAAEASRNCAARQTTLGSGDFSVQLKFDPVVSDPEDPLVLRHTSVWQAGERVVFHYADGTTANLEFTSANASRYLTIGALFELPVPPRAAPLDAIHIETTGSANWRGVILGPTLLKRSEAFGIRAWLITLYAGFAGLSIALLVYNLALWSVLRHRFQLSYVTMVTAISAYAITSSGAVMRALPWLDNNDRLRSNYVLLALSGVAGIRFIMDFFGADAGGPKLRRAVKVLSGIAIMVSLAFAALAPWHGQLLDRLYFLACFALISLYPCVVYSAWRARNRYIKLFLVAWGAPVIVSVARTLHGLGWIGYSFWLDNSNLIAMSIESMVSTLLIVARLRELSMDRDQARAGERTALRLANSDPLTGLLNRRAFMDLAIGRVEAHRLLLIDIDSFKDINDRMGHDAGDEVLRKVAQVIQSIRPHDSLAVRLGGEEFGLLIPFSRLDECPPERVLDAVRGYPMPLGRVVTVSLGFADGRLDSDEGWRRLYRLADSALYRAKSDGRDRACRATDFAEIAAA